MSQICNSQNITTFKFHSLVGITTGMITQRQRYANKYGTNIIEFSLLGDFALFISAMIFGVKVNKYILILIVIINNLIYDAGLCVGHSRVWYSFVNSYERLINPALVPCLDLHKCSRDGVFTASWKKYTAPPQNSLKGKQYINVSFSFPSKLLPTAIQHCILYIPQYYCQLPYQTPSHISQMKWQNQHVF